MKNILDILKSRDIEPEAKKGATTNEFSSPCPKCGGCDRFVTWPDTNRWLCRQCNPKGGNLVAFFQLIDGLSELEALEQFFLCQGRNSTDAADAAKLAIKKQQGNPTAPKAGALASKRPLVAAKKSSKVNATLWLEKAAMLIEWAHKQLLSNETQLSWLQNERGLTLDTIKKHKLGWNPSCLYRERAEWGLVESLHKTTGKPKKLWIPAGLIIPGYDATGALCRIKVRTGGEMKYMLLSGSEICAAFYGNTALHRFAVVESELDAILLQQIAPDLVCPVSAGSAAMKPDAGTLSIIGGHECLLMFDSDEAGIKAAVNSWLSNLSGSKIWIIPAKHGKDCTEAHARGLDLRLIVSAGLNSDILAVTPEPIPLSKKELMSIEEQQQILLKAYERQHNNPDPALSQLIAESDAAADKSAGEFVAVLRKIESFFDKDL